MATASSILDDTRSKFGDTAKNFITDALGLTWLDQGQKELSWELRPLRRMKGYTVSANQDSFATPDDVILPEVVGHLRQIRRTLRRVTPGEYRQQQSMAQNAVGEPVIWTEIDGRIYVWPRYSTASLTTTVNASTTAAATSVTMSSTGNLRSYGMVTVDSEEMEYTAKTSTTITGVRRGIGGTTAATHVSAATVTQLDFEMIYARHATSLASQVDELEIKEVWHYPLLQYYVMYCAYMAEGSKDKAEHMYQMWRAGIERSKEVEKRRHSAGPLGVSDIMTQRVSGLYGPTS